MQHLQQSNTNPQTQRNKLIKRNTNPQDLNSRTRSPSLPSANRSRSNSNKQSLHHRSPTLPSPAASSQTSIDNNVAYTSNAVAAVRNYQDFSQAPPPSDQPFYQQPQLVTGRIPNDLFGNRFDSAAIISNLDAIPYSHESKQQQLLQPHTPRLVQQHSDVTAARPTQAHHARSSSSTVTLANPEVRLSQSLAATGRRMDDITAPRGELGTRSPRNRLSDEAKESKANKKKSGFSSFMNKIGGPKRPAISAPEDPVHVTHVGYDQETGEFTVGFDRSAGQ